MDGKGGNVTVAALLLSSVIVVTFLKAHLRSAHSTPHIETNSAWSSCWS